MLKLVLELKDFLFADETMLTGFGVREINDFLRDLIDLGENGILETGLFGQSVLAFLSEQLFLNLIPI